MTNEAKPIRIDIWHDVLWSRYKGLVFSELHRLAVSRSANFCFYQIAESTLGRSLLGPVDHAYHTYPYCKLFSGNLEAIPKLFRYFKVAMLTLRSRAGLIVLGGYGWPEHWLQAIAVLVRGRRLAVFCESTEYDMRSHVPIKNLLKRFFFLGCHTIFCSGQRSAEYVSSLGVSRRRIKIVHLAAALPKTYNAKQALEERVEQAEALKEAPRYLYVGRFSPEKNLPILIAAFARLLRKHSQATLMLVGNGAAEAELRTQARQLGVESSVFFSRKQSEDLSEEYLRATCLVLPSQSEPWGLVVNEALSYGCPVIVSDRCGCVPELVIEERTGFIVRAGDTDHLVAMMEVVLAMAGTVRETAVSCIDQVSEYTPLHSAMQIYDGCLSSLRD